MKNILIILLATVFFCACKKSDSINAQPAGTGVIKYENHTGNRWEVWLDTVSLGEVGSNDDLWKEAVPAGVHHVKAKQKTGVIPVGIKEEDITVYDQTLSVFAISN